MGKEEKQDSYFRSIHVPWNLGEVSNLRPSSGQISISESHPCLGFGITHEAFSQPRPTLPRTMVAPGRPCSNSLCAAWGSRCV